MGRGNARISEDAAEKARKAGHSPHSHPPRASGEGSTNTKPQGTESTAPVINYSEQFPIKLEDKSLPQLGTERIDFSLIRGKNIPAAGEDGSGKGGQV